jgi:hypothetical protein
MDSPWAVRGLGGIAIDYRELAGLETGVFVELGRNLPRPYK